MAQTPRWGIRFPVGTDAPPDVPLWMSRMATDLDDVAKDDQGTLANRPESTVQAPGKRGRYYWATDTGQLFRDHGTGWEEIITEGDARLTNQRVPTDSSVSVAKTGVGDTGLARGSFHVFCNDANFTIAASSAWTGITFGGEAYDVSGWFHQAKPDAGVSAHSFWPQQAGYYRLSGGFLLSDGINSGEIIELAIFKNGGEHRRLAFLRAGSAGILGAWGAANVHANGTTDYFTLVAAQSNASSRRVHATENRTYFSGEFIGRA